MGSTALSPAVHASLARVPVLGERGSAVGLRGCGAAGRRWGGEAAAAPLGQVRSGKLGLREPPALSGEVSGPLPRPRPSAGNDRGSSGGSGAPEIVFLQGRYGMGPPGRPREPHWLHAKTHGTHTMARR